MGHARALLALSPASRFNWQSHAGENFSSCRRGAGARGGVTKTRKASTAPARGRDIVRLEDELADTLGADVRLQADARGKGALTIKFASLDQLDGIVARLRR